MVYGNSLQLFDIGAMSEFCLSVGSDGFAIEHLFAPIFDLLVVSDELYRDEEGICVEGESIWMGNKVHVETVRSAKRKVYSGMLLFLLIWNAA